MRRVRMEENRSERLRIVGGTMNFELPLDLSRRVIEEAERRGATPAVVVNECVAEMLRRNGYYPDVPLEQSDAAAGQDDDRAQNLEGGAR
jgi:hypothetical protein